MASEVGLTGIPETMLLTLHNRAFEAKRPNGFLRDPECVRIYESIDYDYERSFGKPDGAHANRSRIYDDALRPWLAAHPRGVVVELAAGLETQFQRCDNGTVNWVCVDLPEAIEIRERFLPPSARCRHIARSALDLAWLDEVESDDVFVTLQGLLMYFETDQVRTLLSAIVDRFPGVEFVFDTIPPWFSRKTMNRYGRTEHYDVPPMPWGVTRDELPGLLRSWIPQITEVKVRSYGAPYGPQSIVLPVFEKLPVLRNIPPSIAQVRTQPR